MADPLVTLGGIALTGFAAPERMPFGGDQRYTVITTVGGGRQVQAMGPQPREMPFTGRFRGPSALANAQALDRLRIIGLPVTLTFAGLSYQVLIASFYPDLEKSYEIPYEITCVPTQAESPPPASTSSIDNLVDSDLGDVGSAISDAQSAVSDVFTDMAPMLTEASSFLGTAIAGIGALNGISGLPTSESAGIVAYLNNAQTATQGAINIGDGNVFTGAQEIGGVIPGSPTGGASKLGGQISGLQTLSSLIVARGQIGRAATNVQNTGSA